MEREGRIPPLRSRLPELPPIAVPYAQIGTYGGTLRTIETDVTDFSRQEWNIAEHLNLFTVPQPLEVYANIAESFEIAADLMSVTCRLRKDIKWSDGTPLTTEDFRFAYEDILLYSEDPDVPLTKVAPGSMIIDGEVIELTVIDDWTMRYSWTTPVAEYTTNVFAASNTDPVPAHYLKQFHPAYTESSDMEPSEMMLEPKNMNVISNPDRPTIAAWIVEDVKTGEYLTLTRNPYYWKVDPAGNQLPYLDKIHITYIKSPDVALLNLTAGEMDFETGKISYSGGPILYQSQSSGDYTLVPGFKRPLFVTVWVQQAWIARALRGETDNPEDRKLAELLKNPKFIEALVHGVDTEEMTRAFVGAEMASFRPTSAGRPVWAPSITPRCKSCGTGWQSINGSISPRPTPCSTSWACGSAATDFASTRMADGSSWPLASGTASNSGSRRYPCKGSAGNATSRSRRS